VSDFKTAFYIELHTWLIWTPCVTVCTCLLALLCGWQITDRMFFLMLVGTIAGAVCRLLVRSWRAYYRHSRRGSETLTKSST
jgi:hypothetical protein